ncbi:hypothetical protein POM88_012541 [Heracleum sosnowskyi]|uniref:Uncharacterized protein n=1 Tax=Heracleum sosnowskyi TaxID=360622 RepID=A0AAD8IWY6_9APIA|nr:hypothetical protein POM88_012541 [Heracleum sosnowskyi]
MLYLETLYWRIIHAFNGWRAFKKGQKSDPQRSRETCTKLSNANSALEQQLNQLRKLAAQHADAYQGDISDSDCLSSGWNKQLNQDMQVEIVKALLESRYSMLQTNSYHKRAKGSGHPLEDYCKSNPAEECKDFD